MQEKSLNPGPMLMMFVVAALLFPPTTVADLGRAGTFTVNQTVHIATQYLECDGAPLVSTFAVNVPSGAGQQTATLRTNLASQPGGLTFCLHFYPVPSSSAACPSEQVKVSGHCYPSASMNVPAIGTTSYDFSRFTADNGYSWKMAVQVAGPPGDYNVTGTVQVQFPLGLVAPSVISVTRPIQGQIVQSGGPISVMWTKRGQMADHVRIELVNNIEPQIVQVLVPSTANSGSAQCQAPAHQQGFYRIRVITVDGQVKGESGQFRIVQPTPPR